MKKGARRISVSLYFALLPATAALSEFNCSFHRHDHASQNPGFWKDFARRDDPAFELFTLIDNI